MSDWPYDEDRIVDWRGAIGDLVLVHQHIRELDCERIWANELPRVAASQDDLARIEHELGCELDSRFKAFLACADGWPAFYQWVDLFGTEDLHGEARRVAERQLLELEQRGVLKEVGLSAGELLPIGITRSGHGTEAPDVFVLVRGGREMSGQVLWLSIEEVDRFRDFDAFFLAVLEYNREEIKDLAAEAEREGRTM